MLARGLSSRGHEVTLYAHPESTTVGRLVPWPGRSSGSRADTARNLGMLACGVVRGHFDIVHSFSRLAYLAPILPLGVPKIMSYQREISPRTVGWGHAFSRGTLHFTAISRWMMRPVESVGDWTLIPNGVSLDHYDFHAQVAPDAPLVFLGRIEEIKGPHLAIEIARRAGRRLVIAGNIPEDKCSWVTTHVMPHVDGEQIRYVGPVDDTQKNVLLGKAAGLLMPILWEEPFGIVMAEAMACGTPVIGLRRGAVPEVVEDGITGFVRDNADGMLAAVADLDRIDRAACRLRVEKYYSNNAIVDAYVELYRRSVKESRRSR